MLYFSAVVQLSFSIFCLQGEAADNLKAKCKHLCHKCSSSDRMFLHVSVEVQVTNYFSIQISCISL